jgi:hypothetical protein
LFALAFSLLMAPPFHNLNRYGLSEQMSVRIKYKLFAQMRVPTANYGKTATK